jgi:DNA-binding NarL/FixJ family response regulator
MDKIKVLLVDDHDMFREGIKLLLSSNDTTEVVAEVKNFLKRLIPVNPILYFWI